MLNDRVFLSGTPPGIRALPEPRDSAAASNKRLTALTARFSTAWQVRVAEGLASKTRSRSSSNSLPAVCRLSTLATVSEARFMPLASTKLIAARPVVRLQRICAGHEADILKAMNGGRQILIERLERFLSTVR